MAEPNGWTVLEEQFNPEQQHHSETIFTIGNGFLGTRGTFEELYPHEERSTFFHGVFDDVPIVFTELANTPDWLELEIVLAGERFELQRGEILEYQRTLDLRNAVLRRVVRWRSPNGHITRLSFARFASLADEHLAGVRVEISAENYAGSIKVRSGVNAGADNLGVKHWESLEQGGRGGTAWLHCQTRFTHIQLAMGIHLNIQTPHPLRRTTWDVCDRPCVQAKTTLKQGETLVVEKWAAFYTSRDRADPVAALKKKLASLPKLDWQNTFSAHCQAWQAEWDRCDVEIEGDEEAQLAIRFNLFHLLAAAPRHDEHVNIGAKTLSGYGYRGHAFWDTEIFMLPFFTYTRPEIARNLLSYRYHLLDGARHKAEQNGFRGAQYPWESAGTGEEVTPTWVPHYADPTQLIRIWTGDIEIHISADIAYAIWQYWLATGDEAFLLQRGAEVILETARFWVSRAEWAPDRKRYEYSNVIGPDEYHEHVDNNVFTNAMARWNIQTAIGLAERLQTSHPQVWKRLSRRIHLKTPEIQAWRKVADQIYVAYSPETGLIEQFDGFFQRQEVDLAGLEPRNRSVQELFGIEGTNQIQVLKQPDVLMLLYLLPDLFDEQTLRLNYACYTPRTDLTLGSSLGPSIQSIMAARVDRPLDAYETFIRAARADLFDVRGNAVDGIHGASAGGLWQAVVFGFAGLHRTDQGWKTNPHLPAHWQCLRFKIVDQGTVRVFEVKPQIGNLGRFLE